MGFWGWVWWGTSRSPARENEAKATIHTWMMSASVRRNRARGYCMAPMEAGMGMSCWILLVIVKPVEGKVSSWDHQTPGGNHAWGSNGEGLRALGALGTGPARGVRSLPATPGVYPDAIVTSRSNYIGKVVPRLLCGPTDPADPLGHSYRCQMCTRPPTCHIW